MQATLVRSGGTEDQVLVEWRLREDDAVPTLLPALTGYYSGVTRKGAVRYVKSDDGSWSVDEVMFAGDWSNLPESLPAWLATVVEGFRPESV